MGTPAPRLPLVQGFLAGLAHVLLWGLKCRARAELCLPKDRGEPMSLRKPSPLSYYMVMTHINFIFNLFIFGSCVRWHDMGPQFPDQGLNPESWR